MSAKPARKPRRKKVTLSEFRAWLQGVEELHPDNWHPDESQWALIREKIESIKEEVAPPTEPLQQAVVQAPTGTFQHPPSSFVAQPPVGQPPFMPAAQPPVAEMTPAAKAALAGKLPSEMVPGPDGKVKTPNLDTGDGNYDSSFA